jgi:cytochrome c5
MPLPNHTGYSIGGLLLFVLVLGLGLFLRGYTRIHQTVEITPSVTPVAVDSVLLARGQHLSHTLGCRHCHGANLAGTVFTDAPPFRLTAANLTAGTGGIGARYTTADWARAIRHGVDPSGRPLIGMPSKSFHELSDHDLRALVAFLRRAPSVDNSLPPTTVKPMGYLLAGAGQIDVTANVAPSTDHPSFVPVAATVAYGEYLYGAACNDCHRPTLQGGPHPDPAGPTVPSLQEADSWSYEAVRRAITEGTALDGSPLDDKWMPWSAFRHMTDTEVRALYRFLQQRASETASSAAARTRRTESRVKRRARP